MSEALSITQVMRSSLDSFFATKTIQDIDRSSFLVHNLDDSRYRIKISLVFLKDWDSLETDSYNVVVIKNKGAVFTIPAYWVSVPKELAMTYIEWIINDFYENDVADWIREGSGDNTGSNGGSGNTVCNCSSSRPLPPSSITGGCPYNPNV